MKNWSLKKLVNVAAEICDYALNHYNTGECHRPTTPWPDDSPNHTLAWEALGASSYTLACIAAQHTPGGRNGVESEAPFWALRMWEFMPSKKRRRLAKEFFQGLGAQKRNAKTPHQLVEVAISEADLALSSVDVRCQTCGTYLDGNEPDEVAAGEQCHHCSRAPLAAQKPRGIETFIVVGYYRGTGERFTDEVEATSANAAEDLAIAERDDLVVVASFPKPAGDDVFQVNVDRCYVESANTKEGD